MEKGKKINYSNIEALRKINGYTVDELMQKMGYSRDTYYRVWQNPESGNLKAPDIIKLHELFGVSTDCILGLTPIKISG